ncbi:ABC transporter ATP-binding protein [Sphingobium sp. TA15]|uniref:ABC-type transport system ATPase component n=1 Tax=Sphingobium indicum (strain DSM 16413 / CCM 7287 / MTCC 6362 / UT26 / NBRC 101211 / UT26S) TaxID=452662 RepID=D4Z2B0_SPHIU|nr:ABC transporter ATP-binding protein [Sphingobium indicum]BAI96742.1 ABC-type transport system ATPase component [Sphingobium indicum UT26S]BDD66177.1 ABC transporter ATP-binding protein [Sphingobium sp. TA15]
MINIEGLVRRFGAHTAVDQLTLTVAPGELYALLGPNGAGKSTTIACLLGFERPDEGRAVIDGIDVASDPDAARSRTAYIPEQVSLYEAFTGIENVAYFAELAGHPRSREELSALLSEAGLQADAHDRRTGTYSKGMRQKVGIAIAQAKQAQVLLLDEPTSGLDPASAHEFSTALRRLRDRGTAILMATHDLYRTMRDADRVGILVAGRLVEEHKTSDLAEHDLEAMYLRAVGAVEAA